MNISKLTKKDFEGNYIDNENFSFITWNNNVCSIQTSKQFLKDNENFFEDLNFENNMQNIKGKYRITHSNGTPVFFKNTLKEVKDYIRENICKN